MGGAGPREYASIAPIIVAHAQQCDPAGRELMDSAAKHIDAMAARLVELGAPRLSLMGGLSDAVQRYVSEETRNRLVPASGDALSGALRLAREEAVRLHSNVASTHV